MLKACATAIATIVFVGALRYASTHVWNAAAPLRPAQTDAALNGPNSNSSPRGGLALPFISTATSVPVSSQAPLTRTRQS